MRTPRKRSGLGGAGRRPPRPAPARRPRPRQRRREVRRVAAAGWPRRNRDALRAAIDAAVHGLGRHKEQVAIDRDIALSARTHQRSAQFDLARVIDVVEVDAVIVAHEEMVADEGEVGVDCAGVDRGTAAAAATARRARGMAGGGGGGGRGVGVGRESRGLLQTGDFLQSEDRLAGVEQAGLEANAGIVRAGARVGINARGQQPWWGRAAAPVAPSQSAGHGAGSREREAGAKTAGRSSWGHFFSLSSMPRMILISALCVFSMSVAKSNKTGS